MNKSIKYVDAYGNEHVNIGPEIGKPNQTVESIITGTGTKANKISANSHAN
jgi:hypothetical protein